MSMTSSNGSRSLSSEINVTPLIDILLVLLIIFMVIVPMVPRGQEAVVPKPPDSHLFREESRNVVVSILRTSSSALEYKVNQDVISKDALATRLAQIYLNRAERVMFVKGDDNVSFSQVAEVIDMGHSAGVDRVGLLTPKVLEGN